MFGVGVRVRVSSKRGMSSLNPDLPVGGTTVAQIIHGKGSRLGLWSGLVPRQG